MTSPEYLLLIALLFGSGIVAVLSALRVVGLFAAELAPTQKPMRSFIDWLSSRDGVRLVADQIGWAIMVTLMSLAVGPDIIWSVAPLVIFVVGVRFTTLRRNALLSSKTLLSSRQLIAATSGDQLALGMLLAGIAMLVKVAAMSEDTGGLEIALAQWISISGAVVISFLAAVYSLHNDKAYGAENPKNPLDPVDDQSPFSQHYTPPLYQMLKWCAYAVPVVVCLYMWSSSITQLEMIDLDGQAVGDGARPWAIYVTLIMIVEAIILAAMLVVRAIAGYRLGGTFLSTVALTTLPVIALTWLLIRSVYQDWVMIGSILAGTIFASAVLANICFSRFALWTAKFENFRFGKYLPSSPVGWTFTLLTALIICAVAGTGVVTGLFIVSFQLVAANFILRQIS